ncbi:MAG: folylpolyglutamate synthase/dihydrofolate synthase family protein [Monoglobales bacterium]
MNYKAALDYFDSLKYLGSKPGLERVAELADRLGNPHKDLKIVHVTGTNGKGSTCAMLEQILLEAGYKTGRFSSPWIEKITEQITYCGDMISEDDFADVIGSVKKHCDEMADRPTEFETLTVAAFCWFKRKNCDIVIIEAGMGGKGDATNFIENPILSVITNVALDHTNYLGKTISEIAEHKAGIIKENVPVLFGGDDETALKVIEKTASAKNSELFRTKNPNVISSGIYGSEIEYRGLKLKLSLAGEYQPNNAATTIDAADILAGQGFNISDEDITIGLSKVKWKGRFEILSEDPLFIFDGGHNLQGILYAALSIKKYFGEEKVNILTGVLADKDYKKMADVLSSLASAVFTVTPDNPRALDSVKYAEVFRENGVDATACGSVKEALKKALDLSKREGRPLIAIGSLYLYKDIVG